MKKHRYKLFLMIFLTMILGVTTCSFADDLDADDLDEEVVDVNAQIEATNTSTSIPSVNSRSCVVLDRMSGIILYGKNEKNRELHTL